MARTQAQRTEATRAALVAAGRRLFAEQGYAVTRTEQVVRAAGVTRGALYHHFGDKAELFRVVYEAVEFDVVHGVQAAARAVRAPDRLAATAQAFLDTWADPGVRRVTLLDAPAVLGWQEWKRLDGAYGLGLLSSALLGAMDAGEVRRQPVEPLAHLLLGALTDAALFVARAEDPDRARREVGAALAELLAGLRR